MTCGKRWRFVKATLPRETIYLAQTPQAFRASVLRDAIAVGRQGAEATDEAALAERAGHPVRLVEGEPRNIKITTEADLAFARGLVADANESGIVNNEQTGTPMRVGIGYDLHRVVGGPTAHPGWGPDPLGPRSRRVIPMLMWCVTPPSTRFSVPQPRGTSASTFPSRTLAGRERRASTCFERQAGLVRGYGFVVENLDVTLIAEEPRIGPYIDQMKGELARATGIDTPRISVKGKTNDGVGALGRGEASAAQAIALLRRVGTESV